MSKITHLKGTVRELFFSRIYCEILKDSSTEIAENDRNFAKASSSETAQTLAAISTYTYPCSIYRGVPQRRVNGDVVLNSVNMAFKDENDILNQI